MSNVAVLRRTFNTINTKERKYAISGDVCLQYVLLIMFSFLLSEILKAVFTAVFADSITNVYLLQTIKAVLTTAIMLLGYKFWYKRQTVIATNVQNLEKAFCLSAPFFGFIVYNAWGSHITLVSAANALMFGLAAGLLEELCFRIIPIAFAMRYTRNKDAVITIAIVQALVFGLIHLGNLSSQDLASTLCQVGYAFGIGIFFAAIYLRTGNLLLPIIMHSLYDAAAVVDAAAQASNDTAASGGIHASGIIIAVFGISYGLFLLRRSKRDEIREIWDKKLGLSAK